MTFKFTNIIKISRYVFCIVFLMLMFNSVLVAKTKEKIKEEEFGLKPLATKAGFQIDNTPTLSQMLGQIIGVALSLLGIVFMILIIYGGFLWMTAGGNEENATKAKEIIINAVIGVVIVFAAYAVSNYIINNIYEATTKISS